MKMCYSAPRPDKRYMSPEYTPSIYQVLNLPLNLNIFSFNQPEINEQDELDYDRQFYSYFLSKSCEKPKPVTPTILKNQILTESKEVNFQQSSGLEQLVPTLELSGSLYQNRKFKVPSKRQMRGNFEKENISQQIYTGDLKFYDLKKRFGFIIMDDKSGDIFLCEDDIFISGIDLRAFKDAIKMYVDFKFKFHVKCYEERGRKKRKAVDIEIVKPSNFFNEFVQSSSFIKNIVSLYQ